MSRFVRPSKYRHVFGNRSKVNYENAKISGSAWDTDLVTSGGKYIAVNWQVSGGGAFAILPAFSPFALPEPAGFPTKLPDLLPLARGHTAPVLDTAWSPFDDNIVASSGEDGKIFVWNVDDDIFSGWGDDKWVPEDLSPALKLNAGGRKVGQVIFHPAAKGLLTSASGDHLVRIWDIEGNADTPAITLTGHGDSIQSIAWNAVGTTLATTCRDRKLRLFDPRAGTEAVRITDGHSGIKGSRLVWLGDRDRIATTGFSKMSDRQLGLWDTSSLTNLDMTSVDSSAGIMIPFFAEGNDVLFLAGKGDGNIRYYEFEADQFHFLSEYKTSDPQRGIGFVPRRSLNVKENEIARAFKLTRTGIDPLSFIVPRKAEGFQSDIYPPCNSAEPALTAAEWVNGKTARPNVMDMESRASSANKAPIQTKAPEPKPAAKQESKPPSPKASTPKAATPPKVATPPKAATPPRAASPIKRAEPTEPERNLLAKNLEIDQLESDDEPPAGALAVGGDAARAVGAVGSGPTAIAAPAKPSSSNGPAVPSDHLLVKLLSSSAKLPTRGSTLAAGYDVYAAADTVVPARGKALVDTGLSIAVPAGTYGRIAPRSGLATKHSIDTGAGVIDADYRGPVGVVLFNHGDSDFKVSAGDRIAQLILEKIHMADIRQVDDLDATARGAGGFGSTGF